VSGVDADLPIRDLQTLDDRMARAVARPRFHTIVATLVGVIGLLLAAAGIYSVVAYGVAERRQEFGVRLALGATGGQIWALIMKDGLRLAAAGTLAGLLLALASSRWLGTLLYDVGPRDPAAFAALIVVFACAAIAASLGPARRAMRVDPIVTLRGE
jgi:ABC-type antimicrobial peptide transport system permease subunit